MRNCSREDEPRGMPKPWAHGWCGWWGERGGGGVFRNAMIKISNPDLKSRPPMQRHES
jgi:hypothetical protein